jgi:hypothetical protein
MFDSQSAKKAGKKSKRGPAKKEEPSINDKMELLYEKVLDNLLVNQDKLTKTERLKLFVTQPSIVIYPLSKFQIFLLRNILSCYLCKLLKHKHNDYPTII